MLKKPIKKALLIYPPTGIYDRFERCQAAVTSETVSIIRPPLDLMYLASILERNNIQVYICDYPAENKNWNDFSRDIRNISPELLLISSTLPTYQKDIFSFKLAKDIDSSIVCIMKGVFSDGGKEALQGYAGVDIILRGEPELTLEEFIQGKPLDSIEGLSYRSGQEIKVNRERAWLEDLDLLPFPSRHLTNNDLYKMPDNAKKMGLILAAKGCPFECIFCLVPLVNGKSVRMRSPKSLIAELKECVYKHKITDFWFRADCFTLNKAWVMDLCREIINAKLAIRWTTNSRVDTIDEEMVSIMKQAGCFSIGFGIESGSKDTLDKIKKKVNRQQAKDAVDLCRRQGIQSYLFFVIGFPWETIEHIQDTIDFAKSLSGDIVNFSFATPFPGTELFDISLKSGLIDKEKRRLCGGYGEPVSGTLYLDKEELIKLERSAYRKIILNFPYIYKIIKNIKSPMMGLCYLKSAFRLLKFIV